eukprot:TRINITY_DN1310_c0_g1_i1.p1 TRINITY_DN1310_c0_g1~~TRINITY_DN1310_c0_g1_i1.p1  ORF type:complete len:116 (+),score=29.48 TRINITY_DN1310_c0_g1_i1:103-450(+)
MCIRDSYLYIGPQRPDSVILAFSHPTHHPLALQSTPAAAAVAGASAREAHTNHHSPSPTCTDSATSSNQDSEPRAAGYSPVSYTHLRAHETVLDLVCRLLLEKKNKHQTNAMSLT